MRKLLLLICVTFVAASCGADKGFTVKGEISGLEGKVYLALMQGKTPQAIDSTEAVAGKFEFKGELVNPMLAQIQDAEGKTVTMFFIENSKITINGSKDDKEKIAIAGSAEDALDKTFSVALKDAGERRFEVMDSLIAANPKSVASAYLFFRQRVPYLDFNQMREGVAKFDPSLKNIVYLKMVEDRAVVLEKVDIGKPFIDFELADTAGNMIKLSDVVGKGKYVLLDFWASWCSPCRKENPNVVENFKKYGEKGFTVFGVSLDRKREDWVAGIEKDGLHWTNVSDLQYWNCAPAALYGVGSIPSNVLINPEGIIVERNIREEALGEALEKYLGDKK